MSASSTRAVGPTGFGGAASATNCSAPCGGADVPSPSLPEQPAAATAITSVSRPRRNVRRIGPVWQRLLTVRFYSMK